MVKDIWNRISPYYQGGRETHKKEKDMKKLTALITVSLAGFAFAESVSWDGDSSAGWHVANNWDTDAVPTDADDVTIADNTSLLDGYQMKLGDASQYAKSITVDLSSLSMLGAYNSSFATDLYVSDSINVTSTHTDSVNPLFAPQTTSKIRLNISSGGELVLNNNSSGVVTFKDTYIRGVNGGDGELFTLTGSGTTVFEGDMRVISTIQSFTLDRNHSGTLRIDGSEIGYFQPSSNLRVWSGTLDVNTDDAFADDMNLQIFGDGSSSAAPVVDFSGVSDDLGNLISTGDGGGMIVDDLTALVFDDLTTTMGSLDITGWGENTSVEFASYTGSTGLVSHVTINGGSAYMLNDGGNSYLSPVPEPSTISLIVISAAGCLIMRRHVR